MINIVVGLGSVGSFLLTLLSERGEVLGISRGGLPEVLRIEGAKTACFTPRSGQLVTWDEKLSFPAEGTIFIATKAHHLDFVARKLSPLLTEKMRVVLLQNGLGIADRAIESFPVGKLIRMTCKFGVTRTVPGVVKLAGTYSASLAPIRADSGAVNRVAEELRDIGFALAVTNNVNSIEWEKAILNLVTNPLGTIFGVPNGEILAREGLKSVAERIAEEGLSVARAHGAALPFGSAKDVLALVPPVASNLNSHLVDHLQGRKSDMEFILGEFITRAEKVGIAVPVAETLWSLYRYVTEADHN